MTTALSVGERFLGVDRYCVDQFHSERKTCQIEAMADIYELATLTTVALNDNAEAGLYGVSVVRQTDQMIFQSSTRVYASTLPTLQCCFEDSVYVTRAWTYQEAALSRRCLIFAPSQVHFACRSYTVCESLPLPFIGDAGSYLDWYSCTRNSEALLWSQSIDTAASYRMKIQRLNLSISEYKSRDMTHDTDALNAFRGILARTGLLTLYGLPIHHSLNGSSRKDYGDWVGTLPKSKLLRSLS